MSQRLTREQFVDRVARATATAGLLGAMPNLKLGRGRPAAVVRRDLGGLAANDPILASYRTAITAMKALPSSNPLSWTYQASIHGTSAAMLKPAWATCEHFNYYFWPWHRLYLYYFERIVRKLSGNASWALPFWNYHLPTERTLPAPFRDPAGALFDSQRAAGFNNGTSSLSASDVSTTAGMALFDFTTASDSLESNVHGTVHVRVGGATGHMSFFETAGLDPIFWCHHANVDRLWNLWLAQGSRADPVDDPAWKGKTWIFFDENGNQVNVTACNGLRAAQQLGYTYEGEPAQVSQFCNRILIPWRFLEKVLIRWPLPPIELLAKRIIVKIDIRRLRPQLGRIVESKTDTLLLRFANIAAAKQPGVSWQVFLGPPDTKPDPESPAFVGNMALFGHGIKSTSHDSMPGRFAFSVDAAVGAALRSQADTIELSLVPTGPFVGGRQTPGKPASKVVIGEVTFSVQTQQKR